MRALSWDEVDEIREQFSRLNPYDQSAVSGSLVKIEKENFDDQGRRVTLLCYAISAKRYVLFYRDEKGELSAAQAPPSTASATCSTPTTPTRATASKRTPGDEQGASPTGSRRPGATSSPRT